MKENKKGKELNETELEHVDGGTLRQYEEVKVPISNVELNNVSPVSALHEIAEGSLMMRKDKTKGAVLRGAKTK